LRAVIGLQQPLSGTVATGLPPAQIGILFQDDALLPWKTARENVALGLVFNGMEPWPRRTPGSTGSASPASATASRGI
jgi:ABC-type nitrate/sulfonate/bicarbonate transport system ATPase subunit